MPYTLIRLMPMLPYMGETRVRRLGAAILTALEPHRDERIAAKRVERLPRLFQELEIALRHTECPRCNSRDVELTSNPVSYRSGLRDELERICGMCIKEVYASKRGYAPIYTTS